MKVILFSMLVSGTVELMRIGGGTRALVTAFAKIATTRPKALIGTWCAGLMVFFDDYANCLIVGSSMQPVTDKSKISREKLAYLVDSTAAPVATLALVSTWIGYEVSLMEKALTAAGSELNAYGFFLEGLHIASIHTRTRLWICHCGIRRDIVSKQNKRPFIPILSHFQTTKPPKTSGLQSSQSCCSSVSRAMTCI